MNKYDMEPYDLACMLALQGLLASDLSGKAKNAPGHTAVQAMQCVDALVAELDKKRRTK